MFVDTVFNLEGQFLQHSPNKLKYVLYKFPALNGLHRAQKL